MNEENWQQWRIANGNFVWLFFIEHQNSLEQIMLKKSVWSGYISRLVPEKSIVE